MAFSGSNHPSSDETSYVDMSSVRTDDPFLVGKHCQLEYCNQLDFLPFKCQSCGKIFCSDHRAEDSHKCANAGAWAERRRRALATAPSIGEGRTIRDRNYIPPGSTCAATECRTTIGAAARNTGVHCDVCQHNYCLRHRLQEEHGCAARAEELRRARADKLSSGVENALDSFRNRWAAWRAQHKQQQNSASSKAKAFFKPRSTPAAQRLKLLNELKAKAKGDPKLPVDKRVYLIVASSERNTKGIYPKEMYFYSKDWVVGRLLDAAAKAMQVENLNNQSSEGSERLQVFYVEGEKFLGFSEKIGVALQNGHRVVLTRGGIPPDEVIAMLMTNE